METFRIILGIGGFIGIGGFLCVPFAAFASRESRQFMGRLFIIGLLCISVLLFTFIDWSDIFDLDFSTVDIDIYNPSEWFALFILVIGLYGLFVIIKNIIKGFRGY